MNSQTRPSLELEKKEAMEINIEKERLAGKNGPVSKCDSCGGENIVSRTE